MKLYTARETKHIAKATPALAFIFFIALLVLVALFQRGKVDILKSDSRFAGSLVFEAANVGSVVARNFNVRQGIGVLVASEPVGHIADSMGLHRGDIVTAINDVEVNDVSALMDMIGGLSHGARVKFSVLRNGKSITLSSTSSLYSGYTPGTLEGKNVLFVLAVFFFTFLLIFFNKVERTVMVSLGAIAMVVFGTYMGFFNQTKAFASIDAGTLSLLVGMGFFAIFFEETNFFSFVARKIALLSEGDKTKIMMFLCLGTYLFSMFVNNLSTILIIVPITLKMAEELDLDVVPLLICEVIASNLGGASSMVGDFPNMLISSQTNLLFHNFMFYMFPVCLIELLALFIYMWRKGWLKATADRASGNGKQRALIERLKGELQSTHFDQEAVKKGLIVLLVVIIGFILSEFIYISAPTIALAGGFFLLAFGGVEPKVMFRRINFRDVLFFAALFVMVGAVDASGALSAVTEFMKFVSGGNLLVQALLILWISAFLTAFLNAGPTTALFIPIILRFGVSYPHHYIWWALSLGVLAGSSATLTGATAGAVTVTMIEDYEDRNKKQTLKRALSFKSYAEVGVPIMFLFLAISTAYILILGIL